MHDRSLGEVQLVLLTLVQNGIEIVVVSVTLCEFSFILIRVGKLDSFNELIFGVRLPSLTPKFCIQVRSIANGGRFAVRNQQPCTRHTSSMSITLFWNKIKDTYPLEFNVKITNVFHNMQVHICVSYNIVFFYKFIKEDKLKDYSFMLILNLDILQ